MGCMMDDGSFYYVERALEKKDLKVERVSTGIPKLDELIQGGLPKGSVTLVSGPPGSGKSIMCFHFIDAGLRNGERCLYISVDQKIENLLIHANAVGFDFVPAIEKKLLRLAHIDLEKSGAYHEMGEMVLTGDFDRIVLDSLSPFADTPIVLGRSVEFEKLPVVEKLSSYPSDSRPVVRYHVRRIFDFLYSSKATTLVTSELMNGTSGLSRDTVSEFLADGIILLDIDLVMGRRKLTIWKMRGTKHSFKPVDFSITERGIEIK
ncbi:MAG TPA: hypothetical protein ENG60_03260 [Thermoplasmatales archaeon]|nr:hypothetical protein [Thermoplasmatales archaeon]HEX17409.1 hypothetical protein [Thermoplasmatales archaeon]